MKTLLTTTSLALLLAAPAFADTTNLDKAGENLEQAADATGDAIKETAKDAEKAVENTATDVGNAADTAAEKVDETVDKTADSMDDTTRDVTSEMRAPEVALEGFAPASYETLSAEELTGVRVYDVTEEWIGEVDEVILTTDGMVEGAVVGVGGFLGIGEKDVLIDFSEITLMKEIDGDEMRAYVDASKESLEAMPDYEGS